MTINLSDNYLYFSHAVTVFSAHTFCSIHCSVLKIVESCLLLAPWSPGMCVRVCVCVGGGGGGGAVNILYKHTLLTGHT